MGALIVAAVAFGAVQTDQYYYSAGQAVQITGDNMNANEAVTVDVAYPDASLAQEHVVTADDSGNFADSYTIHSTDPGGVYTVTATGQESGNVYTTTFDPAPPPTYTVSISGPNSAFTGAANAETYTANINATQNCDNTSTFTYAWTVTAGSASFSDATVADPSVTFTSTGTVTLHVVATVASGTCTGSPQEASKDVSVTSTTTTEIFTPASPITYGQSTDISGTLIENPGGDGIPGQTITVTQNSAADCSGSTLATIGTATTAGGSPPGPPRGDWALASPYLPTAAGTQYIKAAFAGTGSQAASFACEALVINKADTATTASSSPASVTYGQSATVDYEVSSAYGISGNTATGTASVVQDSGPGTLTCSATSTAVSQLQNNADGTGGAKAGFDFVVNGSTNTSNEFSCRADKVGSYTFHVHFADTDGNYNNSDSAMGGLSMTVTTAPTKTAITNSLPASITLGGSFTIDDKISSDYGISGNTATGSAVVTPVSVPGGASLGCTPASQSVSAAQGNDDGSVTDGGFSYTDSFSCQPTAVGTYTFHVSFTDTDGNYADSHSSPDSSVNVTLTVLPPFSFTSEGLCSFSNGSTANQFRLIYTPDMSSGNPAVYYKLNASNPGQFSYNIAYSGPGNQDLTLPGDLTAWFVTQGAMPVQIYDSASTSNGCFHPGTLITSETLDGNKVHVPTGVTSAFITIHLDYKWKGASQCVKGGDGSATCASPSGMPAIPSPNTYTFDGGVVVTSVNVFKNDPGIGGLITKSDSTPIQGVQVRITDGSGKTLATVTTDQDGWYMWNYKYTGKAATFTVTLLAPYSGTKTVTLKSNGFLVVNFTQ